MLEEYIHTIITAHEGPEAAAQRCWKTLLSLEPDKCVELCDEIVSYFESWLKNDTAHDASGTSVRGVSPTTDFLDVYLAALYAILTGFATSFAWRTAQASRLRERQVVSPESRTAYGTAAEFLVRICENYFLRTPDVAQRCFRCLLENTGMGVPFLSVVLNAYGSAVTGVLAIANDDLSATQVDRCLRHLRIASEVFALADSSGKAQLTIAHPIFLHVARVSGRVQEALQFFQQPVRSVNPILTGVGLADYVIYYAEAALVLVSLDAYASAFYALTPVHSLPRVRGFTERTRGRSNEAAKAHLTPTRASRFDRKGDADNDPFAAAAAASGSMPRQQQSPPTVPNKTEYYVRLYPWYRTMPVSTTHTFYTSDCYAERAGEKMVKWRLILSPSSAEIDCDEQTRAWAIRLSLLLLTLAFGGGNPREVEETDIVASQPDEREVDWRGMNSAALHGHVCFPNTIFYNLSQTTRVSLNVLLAAAASNPSAEVQVYYDVLRAVAQRDVARARAVLASSSETVFAADMTLHLARAAVEHYLPLHILLDTARMYSRVPLRVLVTRTMQSDDHQDDVHHALAVLQLLAELCATGELENCHVCTPTSTKTSAADTEESVGSFVVAVRDVGQRPVAIDATSVLLTTPPASKCIQLCALVVSLQPFSCCGRVQNASTANAPTASFPEMLTQLQMLQQAVEAEHSALALLN
ncbi:hypothetical protein ABB37_05202 [Leptomonas pyrrhocoris]|uniref:Uncharacterized protein n=1 Tax=Leptomonas pyrrhocoris TaxID=157538 RepID=A0A0N0DVK6_LEPPY|nr:hypothetical protein ABB37_05202 [Leptomonas pyrrhocoris]XP_015658671.1 hypothetical protein ABB37_05202 [Leptomonas pyrrhocoris]KPA80231.1 hypothetical protein ABB37_05202 [Leptomonas pyrrhocoris]KPA80232.1 hypothetical protein ABB37_05202 [Leptomonas pyrrhocoris]|eukprot:XP_015658670.1 hypothetical protein ABB37_05202 [Leptomonas pyrrhocoris]